MPDPSTPHAIGDMYAEFVERPDPASAVEHINERLKEAVVDGDLEVLPQLYTQRAVWRSHAGHALEARNDLRAALRSQLTDEAKIEVYVLLAQCCRMLKDFDGETEAINMLRRCIRAGSVSSALVLREVLACIHFAAASTSAPDNERLSVASSDGSVVPPPARDLQPKPAPAQEQAHTSAPHETRVKSPQDKKKGMVSGFFSAPSKPKSKGPASTPSKGGDLKDMPMYPTQEPSSPVPHKENAKPVLSPGSTSTPRSNNMKNVSKYGATTIEEFVDMVEESIETPVMSKPSAVDPTELDRILAAEPRFLQDVPVHEQRQLAQVMGASSQYASGHQHLEMIERNETIGRCIIQINAGQFTQALADLTAILDKDPQCYQALVARGTCRALAGSNIPAELKKADADFSKAISIMPLLSDVYKRRSQARAALGNLDGAITDLEECLCQCVFENRDGWVEVVRDLASMYHKRRNFAKARKAFSRYLASVDNSVVSKETLSMVGLAATAMGDIDEGLRHYNAAIRKDPEFKEAWLNMFQGLKECGRVEEAEKAFSVIERMDNQSKTRSMLAYRFRAHMMQCMGKHADAIDTLSKALSPLHGRSISEQRIECLYLRGACNHALGRLALAYADYDAAFGEKVSQSVAQETLNFRAVAYYQGEICVYLHRKLDADILHFSIDRDLDPEFKECWAKQTLPTPKLLGRCPRQLKRGQKFPPDRKDAPVPTDTALKALIPIADHIGHLLQYTHQGFMNNTRQQRAAGLAAIELAQRFLTEISARQNGSHTWVSSEGASAQDDPSGRHAFAWRDAMDTVVRWRQVGEPNDQVLWVDRLTPEEFNNGFGSHTPMFSGQTKCVRYYMNCNRALKLFASLVQDKGYVVNADNQQIHMSNQQLAAVKKAKTPASMFAAVGVDSFVVVPIRSLSRNNHDLEGTRLTITKLRDQQDAHEFSIRTPVTPARWNDFDKELCAGFEAICSAALAADKPKAADAILHYAYYWYNFMPLARGSAAVGYTTILSLFWALGMPISNSIPKDYQVDWEAILCQDPDDFVKEMRTWLVPPEAFEDASQGHKVDSVVAKYCDPQATDTFPDALSTMGTIRKRFYALNWGTTAEKGSSGRTSSNGSTKRK